MVEDFSIAAVLPISVWCLFVRRDTWKCKLRRALTVSVILVAVGVVLTSPLLTMFDTSLLIGAVGVQHFDDYLGHLCYLAALCTITYALLARTVPDRQVRKLMRWRVEYPSALAAVVMLALVTASPKLRSEKTLHTPDFFEVPCGRLLHAYWTVYAVALLYLLGYMFRLLLVLRRDPRSRRAANLYLMACVLGMIGAVAEFLDTWFRFIDSYLWLLLTAPAVMLSFAAALSWRWQRRALSGASEVHEDTPPATPKITT